ncbi:MAG: CapA family protein [Gammaproteobacteria bacterium]|nr:MAG: CapA family protein [Gammaproteobacteria bacterium]
MHAALMRSLSHLSYTGLVILLSACSTVIEKETPAVGLPHPPVRQELQAKVIPAIKETTITAVGDIMLGGSATAEMQRYGYDHPFAQTHDYLHGADITFGNLEGPLTHGGDSATEKKYVFKSPPEKVASALAQAGFDVMSLANNHALDYGVKGLTDTTNALNNSGIGFIGAGENLDQAREAYIIVRNGIRFAFLAYSLTFPETFWAKENQPGTAFGHARHIQEDVLAARQVADVVLVSFHWGRESTTDLRPYQIALAKTAIQSGASAVIGHHPHILQAVERYRDGLILYSLGNFAFGSYSRKARVSVIAQIIFRGSMLQRLEMIPIDVDNVNVIFQPTPLRGEAANEVIKTLQTLSASRGTMLEQKGDKAVLEFTAIDNAR